MEMIKDTNDRQHDKKYIYNDMKMKKIKHRPSSRT